MATNIGIHYVRSYQENYKINFMLNNEKPPVMNMQFTKILTVLDFFSYILGICVVIGYIAHCVTQNEVIYQIEVDYSKWTINLPAYTVCAVLKTSYLTEKLHRFNYSSDIVRTVRRLLIPGKKYCSNCEDLPLELKSNLKSFTEVLSEPCEGLLVECRWNERPFQCCRWFRKILTRRGPCFSMNSEHNRDEDQEMTPRNNQADLEINLAAAAKLYVHDRKSLDFFREGRSSVRKIRKGQHAEIVYRFVEWTEDANSWFLTQQQRNCTLSDEVRLNGFMVYSRSACRLRCLIDKQIQNCGCKHHLLPGLETERNCNVSGLACLDDRLGYFDLENCDCPEECSKQEVAYVRYSLYNHSGKGATARVRLAGVPKERFRLTAKTTVTDIIVAVACASRLVTTKSLDELVRGMVAAARALVLGFAPRRVMLDSSLAVK